MPHRFDARLRRLEQQAMRSDWIHGHGLASLGIVDFAGRIDTDDPDGIVHVRVERDKAEELVGGTTAKMLHDWEGAVMSAGL